tara:strand:- start:1146 stop:2843 length:1698 start_codon:yes stop_codon:yes gene_type:complete
MSFKDFNADTKKSVQSNLNQVIDIIQEDISGSATRRKYQTFVTGGIGPGVTSSLYQTIYDQDFTLQTANPVLDMTVGLFHYDDETHQRKNLVTVGTGYSLSTTTGQILFDSKSTMMMREKVNIYRQYANYLLGDPDAAFILDPENYPSSSGKSEFAVKTDITVIDAALFINVKRLFSRDGVRKETFAIRCYKNAPQWDLVATYGAPYSSTSNPTNYYKYFYERGDSQITQETDPEGTGTATLFTPAQNDLSPKPNIYGPHVDSSEEGVQILADLTAAQSFKSEDAAGDCALLRLASDSTKIVGLIFYQAGIIVLNLGGSSVLEGSTHETGESIDVGLGQILTGGTDSIWPVFEVRDPMYGIISGMDDSATGAGNSVNGFDGGNSNFDKEAGQVYIGGDWGRVAGMYDGTVTGDFGVNGTNGPVHSKRLMNSAGTFPEHQMGPATFYPDLLVSASIDDIVDHIGYTRFSSGSLTGMAFQNQTKINSSIYFCRASANEFNTSSNPTFLDADSMPIMIQDIDNDKPFTYITTVALADSQGDVVAVAKLNRPIEKNDESEVTIRVRLDF